MAKGILTCCYNGESSNAQTLLSPWLKKAVVEAEDGDESKVLQDDHKVEYSSSVSGLALFEVEEAEAIDDSYNRVVKSFLPHVGAEICVLPDYP